MGIEITDVKWQIWPSFVLEILGFGDIKDEKMLRQRENLAVPLQKRQLNRVGELTEVEISGFDCIVDLDPSCLQFDFSYNEFGSSCAARVKCLRWDEPNAYNAVYKYLTISKVLYNMDKSVCFKDLHIFSCRVRYGYWYELPPYQSIAFMEGYHRLNDVCKTDLYHGFLFAKDDNMKTMPIYDLNGNLAGIQSTIPGNMKGFNSLNQSTDLPPMEIMPPVLKGTRNSKGILSYTVIAYFKHPKLICSPIATADVSPGKGLYIQMGFDLENDFLQIPLESKNLSPLWKKGPCLPLMGVHYFMNLDPQLPCEKLYPVFLMYDMEGHLGAFGWVFQGRPHNFYSNDGLGHWFHLTPITYPFIFDTSMLPSCMMNSKFQVFGIHTFLRDHRELVCTRKLEKLHLTQRPSELVPVTQIPIQRTIINADPLYPNVVNVDSDDTNNSSNRISIHWTDIWCFVYLCLCSLLVL